MKKYRRVIKTMESDAKFEEKLTLGLKDDMTNFINFNASPRKLENLHFDVILLSIAYNFSAKKSAEELSLITLKSDPILEEKLTFCLKNDMRNLMNFNLSSEKSENLHFDGIFLSKVCNVWTEII